MTSPPAVGIQPGAPGYRICSRCVMDTTDPEILFDDRGICSHCHAYARLARTLLLDDAAREARLEAIVADARKAGRGRDYDCIIGVSGGSDSTYVAHVAKRQLGLRPLAVHMDNGWNSTLAVTNIRNTLEVLGIDLVTEVLDWDEFRNLQLAFLRASTPDAEIPTDHGITAVLMRAARRHRVKYIFGGSNISSEGIMPLAWSRGIRDWRYIRAVNDAFGEAPLRSFPHFTILEFASFFALSRHRWIDILNFVPYVKEEAMKTVERELGWVYYGGKHYESVYTRFFQAYILPRKFWADKRKGHLSTLVCSGQLTREQALAILQEPTCDAALLKQDREFVIKKLGISEEEFEAIMALPPKSFWDYPSYERSWWYAGARWLYRAPRALRARLRQASE